MTDYTKYSDPPNIDPIPVGKVFRISFDATTTKFRIICSKYILDGLINTYSDVNPASFFVNQYGYNVESKISPINTFGYFP